MKRPSRFLLMPFLILGLMMAWGCGGGGFNGGDTDTGTDADDEDTGGDVTTDGEDVPDDVPDDTIDDTPTDVEEDDGGGAGGGTPFTAETAGGSRLTSPNYRLELFVAPVRPVGKATSTNYEFKLGPGGIRSH